MRDREIREKLREKFFKAESSLLVIEELAIFNGKARVDISALSPNRFIGFEIKSGSDNLNRLPNQIRYYECFFDELTILTESAHLEEVQHMVPAHWGIILIEPLSEEMFFWIRPAQLNPNVQEKNRAMVLWKNECQVILLKYKIEGFSRLRRSQMWKLLSDLLTPQQLRTEIIAAFLQRSEWKVSEFEKI